jgi:hypothetical protein
MAIFIKMGSVPPIKVAGTIKNPNEKMNLNRFIFNEL